MAGKADLARLTLTTPQAIRAAPSTPHIVSGCPSSTPNMCAYRTCIAPQPNSLL